MGRLEPLDRSAGLGGPTAADEQLRRRQGVQQNVDLPQGNPLADPLDFSPAERDLFADAATGQLRRITLLDAGLIASGVTNLAAIDEARTRFGAVQNELSTLDTGHDDGPEASHQENQVLRRVALIHHVLHQRLLRGGYDANATNLATTLQTGVYNCAARPCCSWRWLEQYDVPVQAMELPGHVRAMVDCADQRYEIEVTCPVWSQAIRRCEDGGTLTTPRRVDFGDPTLSPSERESGRRVSPLGLVAMIYYNRGIDAFNDRQFATALATNRRALLLDPDNAIVRAICWRPSITGRWLCAMAVTLPRRKDCY